MRKAVIKVYATSQQVKDLTSIVGVDYEEIVKPKLFNYLYECTGIPYSEFSFETEEIVDRYYTTAHLKYSNPWKEINYYQRRFGEVLLCLINSITKEQLIRVGDPTDEDSFYKSNNLDKELWTIEKFLIIPKVDDDHEIFVTETLV